jgi:hypothetical protein
MLITDAQEFERYVESKTFSRFIEQRHFKKWPKWAKVTMGTSLLGTFALKAAQSAAVVIGGQRFRLTTSGNNGWAQDKRMDAAIVAALRNATNMRVESRTNSGGLLADIYRLKGAASAIDAAALGCVRR